jgi:hypothetical protein
MAYFSITNDVLRERLKETTKNLNQESLYCEVYSSDVPPK